MRFSSLVRPHSLLSLCLAMLVAGCGGGSGGDDVGPPPGTQQYPGGFWEGTVGTGAAQRTMVGFTDVGEKKKKKKF